MPTRRRAGLATKGAVLLLSGPRGGNRPVAFVPVGISSLVSSRQHQ
jgi:hypothetical protein